MRTNDDAGATRHAATGTGRRRRRRRNRLQSDAASSSSVPSRRQCAIVVAVLSLLVVTGNGGSIGGGGCTRHGVNRCREKSNHRRRPRALVQGERGRGHVVAFVTAPPNKQHRGTGPRQKQAELPVVGRVGGSPDGGTSSSTALFAESSEEAGKRKKKRSKKSTKGRKANYDDDDEVSAPAAKTTRKRKATKKSKSKKKAVAASAAAATSTTMATAGAPATAAATATGSVDAAATKGTRKRREPSKVVDYDGETPDLRQDEIEVVDPDTIEGLREVRDPSELPYPVPHQPWRRGDLAGCDDPIASDWRRGAEEIIYKTASFVGAQVLDVTWYLTCVVITIDETVKPPVRDYGKSSGPVIDIVQPQPPRYYDPDDPNPEPIWDDDEDVLYTRRTPEEEEDERRRLNMMYANKNDDDPPDEPHIADRVPGQDIPLYANEETRHDLALRVAEEAMERREEMEEPISMDSLHVDTMFLSSLAGSILDALGDVEDDLNVLARHEVILSSPNPAPDVIETQKQFDAYRGRAVVVETQDPFQSNRVLRGRLLDRNSMDVYINQKGNMVTIPLNFVKCVRLPQSAREKEDEEH